MTKPLPLLVLLASALGLPAAPPMVTVGDPGNPAAPNGRGSVAYEFRIGKFEVTNADYVEFLNAVDPEGTAGDQIYLYSPFYWNLQRIGHLRDGSRAQGDRYYVLPGMADKPAIDIGYLPAVRFVNWLHHGAQRYATSAAGRTACSTGAYTVNWYATSQTPPLPNAGAQYWIPTLDEWIKAGFYSPAKGGTGGYWLYATQSDTAPVEALATANGTCANPGPNVANYNYSADWNNQDGHVLTAGSTGSPSYYGTFEQSGSLTEWNDERSAQDADLRGKLGGGKVDEAYALQYTYTGVPFASAKYNGHASGMGFRVAGVTVPKIPFAAWQQTKFTTAEQASAQISGATADPDADGVPNAVEFALGTPPKQPGSPLTLSPVGETLSVSYPASRTAASATLVLDSSTDLVTWTAVQDGTGGVTRSSTPESAESDRITWTLPAPTRQFFRLRATVP